MASKGDGFEITGVENVTKQLKLLELGFLNEIEKAVLKGVKMIEADAKQMVPVITGRLARSITAGITEKSTETVVGIAGANTVYAGTVEYMAPGPGTKSGQRPYLRPARDKNLPQIVEMIKEGLKKTIRGFNKGE